MEPDHYLLAFFEYEHLPDHLKQVSKPFHDLAWKVWKDRSDKHPYEVTAGLRKLLEAKDCIVRSFI